LKNSTKNKATSVNKRAATGKWWARPDLNWRPTGYEPGALA
jgi:hypothetical protein